MKAVILAAGKGTRLGAMTAKIPKCLVAVNDRTILDYQLAALNAAGINDILVVTGYYAEQVEARAQGRYQTLTNRDYATTNSIYSLWLARKAIGSSDFLLLNGDVVIDERLVVDLVNCAEPCAALVDDQKTLADGEMNVVVRNGSICEFSKEVDAAAADGESVQVTKFGKRETSLLFDRIEQLISAGEVQQFPAYAYDVVFENSRMSPVYIKDRWYYEIDTPEDYKKCVDSAPF